MLFPFFLIVWLSLDFARFHEILSQTDSESFSFLSLPLKKFYSKKKMKPLSTSKQKKLCLPTHFSVKVLLHTNYLFMWQIMDILMSTYLPLLIHVLTQLLNDPFRTLHACESMKRYFLSLGLIICRYVLWNFLQKNRYLCGIA